jgi:hypothetical protein
MYRWYYHIKGTLQGWQVAFIVAIDFPAQYIPVYYRQIAFSRGD